MADRSVAYRIALDTTGVVQGSRNAIAAFRQMGEQGADYANKKLGRLERSMRDQPQAWDAAGKAALAYGTGVAVTLGLAGRAAIKWQSDWAGVIKTVDGSTKELAGVEGGLRRLASSVLPATHTEIAAVAEAAGQLGIKTPNVVGFTKTMIDMGESTNLSAEQAATQLARFSNIMGTNQSDIGRLGAAVVGLGNNFATTESEIVDTAMRIAGAGRKANMSEGDVLGLAAALSSVGIEAEAGGTAVSMVMKRMGNAVADGGSAVEDFARVSGMSSAEFTQAWGVDSAGAMATFIEGLGEAQARGENVNKTLSDLGITGIRESDAMLRLSSASDVLTNALATGNEEYARGIALIEESNKRYQTAESRIRIAGNSIRDAAIDFGDVLLPVVAEGADRVRDLAQWLSDLPAPVKEATVGLAGITGGAALAAGGFITLAPKVFETIDGFKTLNELHPNVAAGLGRIGKVLGVAGIAFAGARLAAAGLNEVLDTTSRSSEEMTAALVELQRAPGSTKNTILDPSIWEEANGFWVNGTKDITNWGLALERVTESGAGMKLWFDDTFGSRGATTIVSDTIKETDAALTQLATGGAMETASEGFRQIARSAEEQDISMAAALDQFPQYKGHLTDLATAAGMTADEQTLLKIATGEITPEMLAAGASSDEAATKLNELGVEAQTTEEKIADLADEIRNFGQTTLDERSAVREFEQALDDAQDAVAENGRTLDEATQKGRDNASALDSVASSANNMTASMLENGASADDLAQHLETSRTKLYETARAFGMSETEARAYVDTVMMTPDEVRTKVGLDGAGKAKADAKDVKKAVDDIPPAKTVTVRMKVDQESVDNMNRIMRGRRQPGPYKDGYQHDYTDYVDRTRNRRVPGPAGAKKNYFGGVVHPMAAGGLMDPIAQMVPPNTWRIVGDRLDVPEAYIPLDGSRRSWKILAQTMSRMPGTLPMAAGGLASSDDARRRAEEAARAERERRERVNALRADLRVDLRRGSVRDQVTGGLSGAYSAVDRLYGLGADENLSRTARARATSDARGYEKALRSLYSTMERLEDRTEVARKKLDELKQIQERVASSISGNAYKLDVTSQWSRTGAGVWEQTSGVSGARKNAAAAAARVKELAQKLSRLQRMGYAGAILQEVAQAGSIDASLEMADALLQGSGSDVRSLNTSYADIEKYSQQAGKYVTRSFYDGGVDAAAGLVKGLESQQKQVEATIEKIARGMEGALKRALGIKSPSKVMEARGIDTAAGFALGMEQMLPSIESTAARIASAAVPSTPSAAWDVAAPAAPSTASAIPVAGGVPADEVAQTWDDIVGTTSEALTAIQAQTAATYQQMSTDTLTGLQLNADRTSETMGRLTSTQSDAMGRMQRTQADTLTQMGRTQSDRMAGMQRTNADSYNAIVNTTGAHMGRMRSGVDTTLRGMHGDMSGRLGGLRQTSDAGFRAVEHGGTTAFTGIRTGMNREMGRAPGELTGSVNRLVGVLNHWRGNVNTAFKDVGVNLPAVQRLATGGHFDAGVMPGYTPGRDVHTFYSPTAGRLDLSGGEPVMRPEFGSVVGTGWVDRMNHAARIGGTEGVRRALASEPLLGAFAGGGTIPRNRQGIVKLGRMLQGLGVRVGEHPSFGGVAPVHSKNSWHYRAGALDLNTAPGTSAGEMAYFDRLMPLLYKLGWGVIWRYPNHYGHAHVDLGKRSLGKFNRNASLSGDLWEQLKGMRVAGGGSGGDFATYSDTLLKKAGVKAGDNLEASFGQAAKILGTRFSQDVASKLAGNVFTQQLGRGVTTTAIDSLVEKAKAYGKQAETMDPANTFSGPIPKGEAITRWRDVVVKALEHVGQPTTEAMINTVLRRLRQESGGNPKAINNWDINAKRGTPSKGLMQVIDPTFAAFRDKSLGNNIWDPLQNLVASMRYAMRRYGSLPAAYNRRGGYARGTKSALAGYHWVGEEGAELMRFKGGEQVIPHRQAVSIENQVLRGQTVSLAPATLDELRATVTTQLTGADLAGALTGMQVTLMVDGRPMAAHISATVNGEVSRARTSIARGSNLTGAR